MRQAAEFLDFETHGRGLIDVTSRISRWVRTQDMTTGLLTVLCRHTSASLLIQENAADAARLDLEAFFDRIAPEDPKLYTHNDEGPDDMPAHIRAALTQTLLSIPLINGRLALGEWQGVYLFEHRRRPHRLQLALHILGE